MYLKEKERDGVWRGRWRKGEREREREGRIIRQRKTASEYYHGERNNKRDRERKREGKERASAWGTRGELKGAGR